MTKDEFISWRKRLGLSQAQVAKKFGFSHRSSINHFELGTREISPRIEQLCLLIEKVKENENSQ